MTAAYYNEHEPYPAQWLRNLIQAGHIAPGDVDERDIRDVCPSDLVGYTQCHFFAGIGVWSHALRAAGWPDDRPVWTGSCPCQPFSSAGQRGGTSDERHLWPTLFRLIGECRPPTIFGEQVSSGTAIGRRPDAHLLALWQTQEYLRLLQDRVEKNISNCLQGLQERSCAGMATSAEGLYHHAGEPPSGWRKGALPSARITIRPNSRLGSDEARQRCVLCDGDSVRLGHTSGMEHTLTGQNQSVTGVRDGEYKSDFICTQCCLRGLGREPHPNDRVESLRRAQGQIECALTSNRREIEGANGQSWLNTVQLDVEGAGYAFGAVDSCAAGFGAPHIRQRLYFVADSPDAGQLPGRPEGLCGTGLVVDADHEGLERRRISAERARELFAGQTGVAGFWAGADWIYCQDNRWRAVEPGTQPLAHGVAARVGKLRAYGNAIVAPQATEFVRAYLDA